MTSTYILIYDKSASSIHLIESSGLRSAFHRIETALVQSCCSGGGARWGALPVLVAVDIAALVTATIVAGELTLRLPLVLAVQLALFAARGLYQPRLSRAILDDLPSIVGVLLIAAALAAGARVLLGEDLALGGDRIGVVTLNGVLVLAGRGAVYAAVRAARRRRIVYRRTLVVGGGRVGLQLATLLIEHPLYGLNPVGFFDPDPLPNLDRPLPVLDSATSLGEAIAQSRANMVLVAFGSVPEAEVVDLIRTCDRLSCEIFVVPRLFEVVHTLARDVENIWGVPVVRLRRNSHRAFSWRVKRLADIAVSASALLLLGPALALCALAVRIDGGPGVIFRQERVGIDGRSFTIYKFRTLRPATHRESATLWNIASDDRLSRIGQILRKTSLDELPQLWNVLQGDMSLVGPRPERPYFVGHFAAEHPGYTDRHRVPSGLTGWAQVNGLRGDTSIEERARFDNDYIQNWTLWLDVKIMLRTVSSVLARRGG